jgi:RecG-like helicase
MDRLICGDVGFGKTEVAMRAIFIVVSAGYQAMVLAPTIILAKQHCDVMTERFASYPDIKVAIFSGAQVCYVRNQFIPQCNAFSLNMLHSSLLILSLMWLGKEYIYKSDLYIS